MIFATIAAFDVSPYIFTSAISLMLVPNNFASLDETMRRLRESDGNAAEESDLSAAPAGLFDLGTADRKE